MSHQSFMSKIENLVLAKRALPFLLLSVLLLASCKKGETIEKVGSYSITTKDYEDYYTTFLDSLQMTGDRKNLAYLMCNPDQVPPDPNVQGMIDLLNPENNYEEYRQMRIIEQVARKDGFVDRPDVKRMIDMAVMQTVVNMYVQEKLRDRMKISDADKQSKCEELRRADKRVASLPLDQCMMLAENVIKRNIMMRERPRIINDIRESIAIEKNSKFDRDGFLTKELKPYLELKKEGGCVAGAGATPAPSTDGAMGGGSMAQPQMAAPGTAPVPAR